MLFQVASVHLASRTQGWVVSDRRVLRTDDGGQSWTDATPPGLDFVGGSFFLDGTHGWVASGPDGLAAITVERTTDGGRTWGRSELPDAYPDGHGPVSMSFLDSTDGWLLTTNPGLFPHGVLYRTTDGGATWARETPAKTELDFSGPVAFSSHQTGWAVDQMVYRNLFTTNDGGSTWNTKVVPVPPGEAKAEATFGAPTFFNQRSGVLEASFHRGNEISDVSNDLVFYVTHDGGATWALAGAPLADPAFLDYGGLNPPTDLVDTNTWFVGTARGRLHATHDGGRTWTTITPRVSLSGLDHVDFVNPDVGWAVLSRGGDCESKEGPCSAIVTTVVRTADGGLSWVPVDSTIPS